MTNTTQEFKVGDKVKYKDANEARLNNHNPDMIYTIDEIIFNYCGYGAPAVSFHDSVCKPWLSQLQLAEQPQKHIHHDLIVAWAKDPKGCVIQVKDSFNKWNDTLENNPAWITFCKYRIKPRTKEVQRWKWVVKTIDGAKYFVTDAEYTEDECKATFKHFTGIKIPDTAVTTIEEI